MSDDPLYYARLQQISDSLDFKNHYMIGLQAATDNLLRMMINSGAVPKETAEATLRETIRVFEASERTTEATVYPLKALLKVVDPSVEMPKPPEES